MTNNECTGRYDALDGLVHEGATCPIHEADEMCEGDMAEEIPYVETSDAAESELPVAWRR